VKRNGQARQGFTLIELMVAVAIIAILIAMFFLGFKYVSRNARENQSKASLETALNLLTNYEAGGGSMDKLKNVVSGQVTAPGQVSENSAERNGPAVLSTQKVMKLLLAYVNNRKIVDGMKPELVWRSTDASGQPTVVLLDGYNNPIIFVPSDGLSGVGLGKRSDGSYAQAGQVVQSNSPGRPFFASAGEDGSFKDGDDNRYSFPQ
jgi:prepilin-type N-terminal cleavage/methylation domain-containing protein